MTYKLKSFVFCLRSRRYRWWRAGGSTMLEAQFVRNRVDSDRGQFDGPLVPTSARMLISCVLLGTFADRGWPQGVDEQRSNRNNILSAKMLILVLICFQRATEPKALIPHWLNFLLKATHGQMKGDSQD